MVFVKICGIQNATEARLALDYGATALGFLVGLTHRAEDEIGAGAAREIVQHLLSAAEPVLVTHLLNPSEVADRATGIGCHTVQVHGDMAAADLRQLRALVPRARLIKAIHVTSPEAVERAREYASVADALLLDSRTADRLGGTGLPHDWSVSRAIVAAVTPLSVYLAGGLRPENVEAAIAQVRPAGVDVNSGVEDANGHKDPVMVRQFVPLANATLIQKAG